MKLLAVCDIFYSDLHPLLNTMTNYFQCHNSNTLLYTCLFEGSQIYTATQWWLSEIKLQFHSINGISSSSSNSFSSLSISVENVFLKKVSFTFSLQDDALDVIVVMLLLISDPLPNFILQIGERNIMRLFFFKIN